MSNDESSLLRDARVEFDTGAEGQIRRIFVKTPCVPKARRSMNWATCAF